MRVLIADDEALLREGLARLLEDEGFEVVARVGTAEDALRRASALRPDVAVLDVRMPPTHTDEGMRLAAELGQRHPEVGVLVLSQHVESELALRLLESRTRGIGYLLKQSVADFAVFADAVRRVGAGGAAVDPRVVRSALERPRVEDPLADLSARERELLGLMAEGLSNAGIGRRLFLSGKTVESHVRNILSKLDIPPDEDDNRRVRAVLTYLRAG